jgi:hypothetical protein
MGSLLLSQAGVGTVDEEVAVLSPLRLKNFSVSRKCGGRGQKGGGEGRDELVREGTEAAWWWRGTEVKQASTAAMKYSKQQALACCPEQGERKKREEKKGLAGLNGMGLAKENELGRIGRDGLRKRRKRRLVACSGKTNGPKKERVSGRFTCSFVSFSSLFLGKFYLLI